MKNFDTIKFVSDVRNSVKNSNNIDTEIWLFMLDRVEEICGFSSNIVKIVNIGMAYIVNDFNSDENEDRMIFSIDHNDKSKIMWVSRRRSEPTSYELVIKPGDVLLNDNWIEIKNYIKESVFMIK